MTILDSNPARPGISFGTDMNAYLGTLSRNELRQLFERLRVQLRCGDEGGRNESAGERLTSREREVLILIASGYTRGEIGEALSISTNTAATHVASIYRKLDVGSIAEATRHAIREGLVAAV